MLIYGIIEIRQIILKRISGCIAAMTSVSQVIGPVVQYRIPKITATKVEVVAMIPKIILQQLTNN
jgi:hypothetical protein